MKELRCTEHTVDNDHSVLIVEREGLYECFVGAKQYAFEYMFGLPVDQQSFEDACKIAIANAPDYYDLFEDE